MPNRRASTLAAMCLAVVACRTPEAAMQRAQVEQTEPRPRRISAAAREVVWQRMQGHGADMTMLLWALLFLDYDGALEISQSIVEGPRMARPQPGDDTTLNAQIPAEFFDLQDQLAVRAKRLAQVASAREHDPGALARAYGELAETCVRCHSTFLYEDRSFAKTGERNHESW